MIIAVGVGAANVAHATGDANRGAEAFGECKGCHQVGEGAVNRIGPHLNGLFGRKAAALDGFAYSKGFKRAGEGGLEWHGDTLDAFLEAPKSLVTGSRMSYGGMKDAGRRADLIAYLRTFSASPADIPEADPTAEHTVSPDILALVGDPEYGEYLSSECTTCHQTDGSNDGIPSIVLWPEDDFVTVMHSYRDGVRPHPVMQMIATRLNDEEIAALAAYFATPPDK